MIEFLASFFGDGGIFMYFILAASIVGVAISIERVKVLVFRYNVNGPLLWEKISKSITEGRMDEAKAICADSRIPLMKILSSGLDASGNGEKEIQNAVDAAALEMIPAIDKRVPYLAMLANIATLLGLLGTIQGLIQAFSAVGNADPSQKAALLSQGISIALYTTAFGLVVAIPLLVLYSILQSKAHKIVDEIDEFSVKLINLLARGGNGQKTK